MGSDAVLTHLKRMFAVDTRTLAAFRIALGSVILVDLSWRLLDLRAFHTDAGVLPREVMLSLEPEWYWLLLPHSWGGSVTYQATLFVVAAAFAVALVLGYRTRAATAACLLLTLSLHGRNPLVLNAGDQLLVHLLFWSLFLPLGERWSYDARFVDEPREEVVGLASAALLLQVFVVYLQNAVWKLRGDVWLQGDALAMVLENPVYAVYLSSHLAEYPTVVTSLNYIWLLMLSASFLLLLLTGWVRAVFAASFAAAHAGMFLTISLALFPLVSIVSVLPFVQREPWDVVESRWPGVFDRTAPQPPSWLDRATAWTPPSVPSDVRTLVLAVLVMALLMGSASAMGYADAPQPAEPLVEPLETQWSLFAPDPSPWIGWSVVPGELESDETFDVYHETEPSWDWPPDSRVVDHARWRTYGVDVITAGNQELRPPFGDYVCERYNLRHDDEVERLELHRVLVKNPVVGGDERDVYLRLEHGC